jgi:reductive dehalogenase
MAENLTRREFMRELGMFGAAASLAPMVGSVEQMSDKPANFTMKRPGFVKEVDEPTIEVDWSQVKRYNERHTTRRGFSLYVAQEKIDEYSEINDANLDKWVKEGKPGYTLKDRALQRGVRGGAASRSFLPPENVQTPESWGVPKWTGSPEDAAQMVTAAMRHFGAATVGFVKLETDTTEKLIYSVDPDGKQLNIEDVDEPAEDEETRTIPKKARWAVVYTVQMSEETMARAPTVLGSLTTSLTYTRSQNIQARAQNFLSGLGYMALAESSTNALGISPALGVMGGLGELSRLNRLITPEHGPMVRVFKLLTDLPLATGKPIDAGIMDFCMSCTKCADYCPSKSLSFDDPTWEVRGGWNNPGHKAFYEDSVSCRIYWRTAVSTNCGICFAVCPFASKNLAAYNRMRNAVVGTTPIFNRVFKSIDDLLYTPEPAEFGRAQKDPELWWSQNLPDYGIDTVQTVRETS